MFLHITFTNPGDFTQGSIATLGDNSLWTPLSPVDLASVPPQHAASFASLVAQVVALGEPWSATQAWAYPITVCEDDPASTEEEPKYIYRRGLEIVIEARHDVTGSYTTFSGSRGIKVTDQKYLDFYDYFVQNASAQNS